MPRMISRPIHDALPTADTVREAGEPFREHYWMHDEYPNLRSGIVELGLREGQRVTRADVFRLVEDNPRQAVMLTLVWGYPKATINGHRLPLETVFHDASMIADRLKELQDAEPLPARLLIDHLNELCGKGASTSTTSKLAYFFGLKAREGDCVIYDYKVINTIMEGTFREFLALRRDLPTERLRRSRDKALRLKDAQGRQTRTYAAYLKTVNGVAKRLTRVCAITVTADQVELALFGSAPERTDLSARTRASKLMQAQANRRKLKRV